MIVLDASAALEILLGSEASRTLRARIVDANERLAAPHLIDVEVTHVLRRYERSGEVGTKRAELALSALADLPIARYPHTPLLPRVWQLRGNLTGYDAIYVALAEALDASLFTRDAKLAAAPGHRARVETF